jgi:hypothetical protein
MNSEEIIEMARQAGFLYGKMGPLDMPFVTAIGHTFIVELEAFAKLVAAKKQEDIIQIIKETPFSNWFQADVIEAIKARGEQA